MSLHSPTLGYSVLQSDSDVNSALLWFAELHVHLLEEILVFFFEVVSEGLPD
jgi:hypothetical protein